MIRYDTKIYDYDSINGIELLIRYDTKMYDNDTIQITYNFSITNISEKNGNIDVLIYVSGSIA